LITSFGDGHGLPPLLDPINSQLLIPVQKIGRERK
jgi:hypothetical protein